MKSYFYVWRGRCYKHHRITLDKTEYVLYKELEVGVAYDKDLINIGDMHFIGFIHPQDCINECSAYLCDKVEYTYLKAYEVEIPDDSERRMNNDVEMAVFDRFRIIRCLNDIIPNDALRLHTSYGSKSFSYCKKDSLKYNVWSFDREGFLFPTEMDCIDYSDGTWVGKFAVGNANQYMFASDDGSYLSKQYDYLTRFHKGVSCATYGLDCFLVDRKGNTVTDAHYDLVCNFNDKLWLVGCYKDGYGYCLLKDENCTHFDCISCGFTRMLYNVIDENGNEKLEKWVCKIGSPSSNIVKVVFDDKSVNIMDSNGTLLCKSNYDEIGETVFGIATVKSKNKWNFVKDGIPICDDWYDECLFFRNGYGLVKNNGMYNYVNEEGRLISEVWFDNANMFKENGLANVCIGGCWLHINGNGEIV